MKKRIGFVGVGRMGANMARHLKEVGWPIVAIYDGGKNAARSLARELDAEPCATLARVTELSDIILTVVTDDQAMKSIFAGRKDNLLVNARGKLFVNCATVSPATHVHVEKTANRAGAETLEACMASSITQARDGHALSHVRRREAAFENVQTDARRISAPRLRYIGPTGQAAQVKALVNMVMNINTAGLAEGLGSRRRARPRSGNAPRSLLPDRRELPRPANRWRRHAEPRARLLFLRRPRRQGQRHRPRPRQERRNSTSRSPQPPTNNSAAWSQQGLGELDKSGIAELTFKNRAPR